MTYEQFLEKLIDIDIIWDEPILLFFIDYTELCDRLIEKDEVEEHEYYGNHTIYQTKTVKCKELFDYLTQKGLIQ